MTGDGALNPFRISVDQEEIDDLYARLERTRWPDQLADVGWAYGIPRDYVMELADYWRHQYDWRAAEGTLNTWPQYTTTIDGARIHFAHIRSSVTTALPLMMIHGWPGSFSEFAEVVGPLTEPHKFGGERADAFHLILPSIPGFGFSGPTSDRGWEVPRIAAAFAELLRRLGYKRYGTQGGDWGSAIARELGRIQADRVAGVHVNLLVNSHAAQRPEPETLNALTQVERKRTLASWGRQEEWIREKAGYAAIQSTRPQTLAYSLTDSPIGLLAWITEKFWEWTDSTERPEDAVDRDHMLTNVSIYWFTRTIGSSARIYYDRAHAQGPDFSLDPSNTPTGVAVFPHENFLQLRHIGEKRNNIARWTEFDRGGHFAALEEPDLLVGDIRAFFREYRAG